MATVDELMKQIDASGGTTKTSSAPSMTTTTGTTTSAADLLSQINNSSSSPVTHPLNLAITATAQVVDTNIVTPV